jgi:Carbohydrate esterase, sialic acid-specific acetylesterase
MYNPKKYLLSIVSFYLLGIMISNAQISIKIPYEKSVFQRNNSNIGNIFITGTLEQDVDRVEARIVPRIANQGVQTEWKTIDNIIDGQSFTGSLEGQGGWYRLEVRAILNNQVTFTNSVEKVGIGEVFIVAGQSNAQGDGRFSNAKSSSDERVLAFEPNYYDHNTALIQNFPNFLSIEKFTNISSNTNIGPLGFTAWCWGELGDQLVKKLNVPVLFYNAALSGTSTENWLASISGKDTYHVVTGVKFEKFMPYHALRRTLHSLISIYGVRSILWHQGESDAISRVSELTYFNNLRDLIQESRNNTGEKIPWVVARVSRYEGSNYPNIISGQNRVISTIESVWAGPSTDEIQPFRPDGAHFENNNSVNGLSQLADAWNASLSNQFFDQINPILPKGIAEIKYSCINQSDISLKFDKIYQSYQWSTGATSSQIQANNGEISAVLRDGFSNLYYTNRINVPDVFPKIAPIISPVISIVGCVGKTVELQANPSKYEVNWNNGTISNKISANQVSSYFASYRSSQGCLSPRSNELYPIFVNPPPKPGIELLNSDGFECIGKTISLKVSNPQNFDVVWSTGQKTNELSIANNQSIPIKVTLFSNYDCPSVESDTLKYRFLANPKTPNIEKNGPFSVKAIELEPVQKFEWFLDNNFLLSQVDPVLFIEKNGFYATKAVRSILTSTNRVLECKSGISTQQAMTIDNNLYGLSVYANPVIDGKVKIASNKELKNVKVTIFNDAGQKEYETILETLKLPTEIDLSYKRISGKRILKLDYSGLTRSFPLIFE